MPCLARPGFLILKGSHICPEAQLAGEIQGIDPGTGIIGGIVQLHIQIQLCAAVHANGCNAGEAYTAEYFHPEGALCGDLGIQLPCMIEVVGEFNGGACYDFTGQAKLCGYWNYPYHSLIIKVYAGFNADIEVAVQDRLPALGEVTLHIAAAKHLDLSLAQADLSGVDGLIVQQIRRRTL